MSLGYFECNFCGKKFVSQNNYEKHSCEQKERHHYIRNDINGRRALMLYKHWLNFRNRQFNEESFLNSRYYNAFVSLSEYVFNKSIPSPKKYVEFCEGMTLLPQFWKRDDVFLSYMKQYDSLVDPLEQVEQSIRILKTLAGQIGCKLEETFKYLYGGEVVKLLSSRQISPYFIVLSKTYLKFKNSLMEEEKILLDATYNNNKVWDVLTKNENIRARIEATINSFKL